MPYDFYEMLNKYGNDRFDKMNQDSLFEKLKSNKVEVDKQLSLGKLLDKAFSYYVEGKLINPTFIVNYPKLISPLAKTKRGDNIQLVERFELFINGMEIANSFSELNDPIEQRNRLEEQNALRKSGDVDAQMVDEEYLEAMEYGMPPCGGVGIGIDRLTMILTKQKSIKDVILFPAMKNEASNNS